MDALDPDFYARPVLDVARELIGCTVEHAGVSGVIVETEAYHESEPACHAFVGLTPRTSTLFGEPGRAYVYRSYGVHAMLNAVCEPEGVGAAVLIRALQPLAGIERMRARRGRARPRKGVGVGLAPAPVARAGARRGPRPALGERDLCSGPGKLTQALAITLAHNATSLTSGPIRIAARAEDWLEPVIVEGVRVGITKAVELRWRFCVAGSGHVSRPRPVA
jgi:DNA-3-methyladenine glycosylase